MSKRLGPEFISTRPGPGNQKIAYLSAEKAINLANEVFGFNGWSSSIQNIQIDFVEENATTGKVSIGLSVVIRVTLKDGTYHEDIGYGGIENCKGKAMAFEKSKKEATTDALKRALRNFGNVLGNCIYDKDFVTRVSKVKAGPTKFEVNDLYRHPDFAPKQEEDVKSSNQMQSITNGTTDSSPEFEDSFDVADFDDVDLEGGLGRPDEVIIPADIEHQSLQGPGLGARNMVTPSKAPQIRPSAGIRQPAGPDRASSYSRVQAPTAQPNPPPSRSVTSYGQGQDISLASDKNNSSSPGLPSEHFAPQHATPAPLPGQPAGVPVAGFYSAKAAQTVDEHNVPRVPVNIAKFNPHAESPSIRKTAGIDHNKSVPVKRDIHQANSVNAPKETADPKFDSSRRVGLPGQTASGPVMRSSMSTSAYRPPTRHASPASTNGPVQGATSAVADRNLNGAKRHPLGDVSNMQHNVTATTGDGLDAKRQRIAGAGGGMNTTTGPENTSV